MTKNKRLTAFTLAEVLITLGVIGVVAAMTMPTLIRNYRDKETVVALKKINTEMTQALSMAITKHGDVKDWGMDSFANSGESDTGSDFDDNSNLVDVPRTNAKYIVDELRLLKDCGRTGDGCFYSEGIMRLDNKNIDRNIGKQTRYYKVILANGTMVAMSGEEEVNGGDTFEIWVDVNGNKKPNTLGKDVFMFSIKDNKFTPFNVAGSTSGDMIKICSPFQKYDGASRGYQCAAWVLYKENLDYLYCDDLNWSTKSKCK